MNRRQMIKGLTVAAVSPQFMCYGDSPAQKPNVLLLFSDQHNAGVFGHAGHQDVITPNFDKFATESIRFDRAYCQDGVCCPSRNSMMTGRYCRSLGTLFNSDKPRAVEGIKTMPELFQQNGYYTAAFGKRHLHGQWDAGFDYTCTSFKNTDSEPSDESYWDWIKDRGQAEEFAMDWAAEHGGKYPRAPMSCRISKLTTRNKKPS